MSIECPGHHNVLCIMMTTMAGKAGKRVFLKNWAGKGGFFFLTQISLSIPFIADMGNKFFVYTCH